MSAFFIGESSYSLHALADVQVLPALSMTMVFLLALSEVR
jgi:hypothetical protein